MPVERIVPGERSAQVRYTGAPDRYPSRRRWFRHGSQISDGIDDSHAEAQPMPGVADIFVRCQQADHMHEATIGHPTWRDGSVELLINPPAPLTRINRVSPLRTERGAPAPEVRDLGSDEESDELSLSLGGDTRRSGDEVAEQRHQPA